MIELYERMLKRPIPRSARRYARIREAHRRQAHQIVVTYWYRIVPVRSYVKGWKICPSHYLNQDLANIWLDK